MSEELAEYKRLYYLRNREEILQRQAERRSQNREKFREQNRAYRIANPGKAKEARDRWRKANPEWKKEWDAENLDKHRANAMRRNAAKLRATPKWANEFFISEAYRLAVLRTRVLGFPWEVDHIVPLRSKRVCGLHVEQNLQVIPAVQNHVKGNRHWPDMPGQENLCQMK